MIPNDVALSLATGLIGSVAGAYAVVWLWVFGKRILR